jgi:hypothetical protein
VTKPKSPGAMTRANRRLGDVIRAVVRCPIRHYSKDLPLRVIAYRQNAIRLECPRCGQRFTLDRKTLDASLASDPDVKGIADMVYNSHDWR